jgi:uncharacterized protein (DUF433 family)
VKYNPPLPELITYCILLENAVSDRRWRANRITFILTMNYRDHITIEPNKRGGKPCVRGLRITVYEVLEYLASEMTEAEILDDFPDLT